MNYVTYFRWVLGSCGCLLIAAQSFGQSTPPPPLAVVPTPKPTEIVLQRTRPAHLTLKVDGTDVQVVSPGLFIVREASPAGQVNLTATGYRFGSFFITVTSTKDGKLCNHQFKVRVNTVFHDVKVP